MTEVETALLYLSVGGLCVCQNDMRLKRLTMRVVGTDRARGGGCCGAAVQG
jgi:hypothetical protein